MYGLYYFVLQWLGEAAEPTLLRFFPALPRWRNHRGYKLWQVVRTFVLVNLGMLIFRSNGTRAALEMLASLARPYTGSLLIKLDIADLGVLAVGAVGAAGRGPWPTSGASPSGEAIARRPLPLRWAIYCGAMLAVMIFGAYGDNYDPRRLHLCAVLIKPITRREYPVCLYKPGKKMPSASSPFCWCCSCWCWPWAIT